MGMKQALTALTALALLVGCAAPTTNTYYAQANGSAVRNHAAFVRDKAICLGETGKAQLSGSAGNRGDEISNAIEDLKRDDAAGNVMLGCMAQKGYRLMGG